ncbi:SURF1 family protein [Microbacterium sp. CFBP 8790]|uniref:SURF1 family cytochrome oxidase biogenesis protein n=1 Tax=unclassified Microbacterium TaxID=2609290 RepID=UPI001786E880|nr:MULTISPECIES: SURF1 family protein [unclassified Microbacterium]MBD8207208.1 SURF1 family protein [Microbacterium sp. CFBP 8801]MBD8510930.1 SURF1 family protein [Microbacterium sp. CFBP 8790]
MYVGVAILFAIACAFLSNWQFSRNAERSEQLELVANNYDAAPVALGDLLAPGAELTPSDEWRPVRLEGRYLADEQLLVRNRAHGGSAAYEQLVPFRLDDGRTLLVDRGWLPPGNSQSLPDDIPDPPSGEVTVEVRLRPGEAAPTSGRTAEAGQVPTINLGLVAEQTGPLEPGAYGLLMSETPAPATAPLTVDPPSNDPGPYLSYAIQWILFALMGFGFITYVIVSERRLRREDAEDDDDDVVPAAAPVRADEGRRRVDPVALHRSRKLPRDRDADDEDALLDAR